MLNLVKSIFLLFFIVFLKSAFSYENVYVKNFIIEGNKSIPSKIIYKIVEPFKEKYLTFDQIKSIAEKITKLYIENGYITSKAYIPPQDIKDGIVVIKIFEGKVGNVYIEGSLKYYSRDFIKSFFEPLEGKTLNKNELERVLFLINDFMDLKVSANLKKGERTGTTDIYVNVENNKYPFKGAGFYDNWGSEYISKNRYGLNLNIGNILTEGSVLSLTGIMGDTYDDFHTGSVSYQLPVGYSGLKAGALVSVGNSNIGKELAVLNIKSYSRFYSLYLIYPIIKTVNKDLSFTSSFNVVNFEQSILGETTTRDKYRYIDLSISYTRSNISSQTRIEFIITQGLGKSLDGILGESSFTTRAGASGDFTKFNLNFIRYQKITDSLFVLFDLKSQYSKNKLVASQNFYIGGPASIRGYLLSQYGGDSGYSISTELRWSPLKDKEKLQFISFLETGWVFLNSKYIGQNRDKSLTGAGFGIRLKLPWKINLSADLAFPISPEVDGDDRESNFYCQLVKFF